MKDDIVAAHKNKKLISTARFNLAVLLAFTVLNLVMLFVDNGRFFLFSSTICYYLPYFGYVFDLYMVDTYTLTGLVLGLIPLVAYVLCWLLSLKSSRWLIPVTALFVLDTLAMVGILLLTGNLVGMILSVIVYVWILVSLIRGILAGERLRKMPAEPVELTEEQEELAQEPEEDGCEYAAAEQE